MTDHIFYIMECPTCHKRLTPHDLISEEPKFDTHTWFDEATGNMRMRTTVTTKTWCKYCHGITAKMP